MLLSLSSDGRSFHTRLVSGLLLLRLIAYFCTETSSTITPMPWLMQHWILTICFLPAQNINMVPIRPPTSEHQHGTHTPPTYTVLTIVVMNVRKKIKNVKKRIFYPKNKKNVCKHDKKTLPSIFTGV